jgi:hypothetical protein
LGKIGKIGKILSKESFAGFFGEQQNLLVGGRYRPLSLVTFAIEKGLFGQNAALSHFINLEKKLQKKETGIKN